MEDANTNINTENQDINTDKQPDGAGYTVDNWRGMLSEEYQDKFKELQTPDAVFKDLVGLKEKMGSPADYLRKPGEDATDEQKQAFRQELGKIMQVPETEEGYEFSFKDEALKEAMDADSITAFKKLALEHQIPPAAAQALMDFEVQRYEQAMGAQAQALEQASETLKQEWGADYEAKLTKVQHFAQQQLAPELVEQYGNDPVFIKGIAGLMSKFSEDVIDNKGGTTTHMSSAEKRTQAQGLMKERTKHEHGSAEYEELSRKISALYKGG